MKNQKIVRELRLSCAMELNSVQNDSAACLNLNGVRPDVIKKTLAAGVLTEIQHVPPAGI